MFQVPRDFRISTHSILQRTAIQYPRLFCSSSLPLHGRNLLLKEKILFELRKDRIAWYRFIGVSAAVTTSFAFAATGCSTAALFYCWPTPESSITSQIIFPLLLVGCMTFSCISGLLLLLLRNFGRMYVSRITVRPPNEHNKRIVAIKTIGILKAWDVKAEFPLRSFLGSIPSQNEKMMQNQLLSKSSNPLKLQKQKEAMEKPISFIHIDAKDMKHKKHAFDLDGPGDRFSLHELDKWAKKEVGLTIRPANEYNIVSSKN